VATTATGDMALPGDRYSEDPDLEEVDLHLAAAAAEVVHLAEVVEDHPEPGRPRDSAERGEDKYNQSLM
jgi:hypothetical protein